MMFHPQYNYLVAFLLLFALFCLMACTDSSQDADSPEKRIVTSLGRRIQTLDPALAADTTSQYAVAGFYDTLLQYKYEQGVYQLEPAMLQSMPQVSDDGRTWRFVLRDDLFFHPRGPFRDATREARRVTAHDVVFSLLRLADPRLHSPGYWVLRGKIPGLDDFRERASAAPADDLSPYDNIPEAFRILSANEFELTLAEPQPRLEYLLAMPYCSVLSRAAVAFYKDEFAQNPVGSGPFLLSRWDRDYVLEMTRYDDFREEFFTSSPDLPPARLPLADSVTCFLVKQPLASWLMFLQGGLDYYAPDGEYFDAVTHADGALVPALTERGIRLAGAPELQTNYIGFHFADPLLSSNKKLRQAIALAFDKDLRLVHAGGLFVKAYGPVPPGVPGSVTAEDNSFAERDLPRARALLVEAGYPDGMDPATKKPLRLRFDLAGSDTFQRQTAELLAGDLRKIGIELEPSFNTRPRFFQKLASGDMQLFRLSWTGDYPDAENFLQLFYGPNAGSCNRVAYRNAEFDRMFAEIFTMPDSPERTEKYLRMARFLVEETPWIFESHTVARVFLHAWLRNYFPHDFAFNRWKYLDLDPAERRDSVRSFQRISMDQLRK